MAEVAPLPADAAAEEAEELRREGDAGGVGEEVEKSMDAEEGRPRPREGKRDEPGEAEAGRGLRPRAGMEDSVDPGGGAGVGAGAGGG